MKNFQVSKLYLVNPGPLDDECFIRAVHATDILDTAEIFTEFSDAVKDIDMLIATSSIETVSDKKHLRNPLFPAQLSQQLSQVSGSIGLVFGREDYGLLNPEIAQCDLMIKIPTSEAYPSLNLSHAVAVVLYELYTATTDMPKHRRPLDSMEKNILFDTFSELLDNISYPDHKKEKTQVMFKRMMGRALPSKWEYHTLMGVLKSASKKCEKQTKSSIDENST